MEGTPLDTRSWALYRDGLQPRGWEGLLDVFFLKLEAINKQYARIWREKVAANFAVLSKFLIGCIVL